MSGLWTVRFKCDNCLAGLHGAMSHPTLGPVCPLCLHPLTRRNGRRSIGSGKRAVVAVRDMWKCHLCGGYVDPKGEGVSAPTMDHVIPVSHGGSDRISNLKLAHEGCNNKRGNALLPEAGQAHG